MPKVKISNSKCIEQTTGTGVLVEELTMRRDGEAKLGHTGFILGKNSAADATADPYQESATQLWPLGTRMIYGDRQFVYALMGGSGVTAGKLVQSAVHQGADHLDMDVTSGDVPAIGAHRISIETNGTDLTKDQYAGGYIYVNDGTGEGQLMKIKSHAAHDHSNDPTCVFTTFDPVTVALVNSDSKVTIHQQKHYKVVIAAHAETAALAGLTVRDMSADYYGWLQVSGPAAALTRGTIVVGNQVNRSTASVNGAVEAAGDDVSVTVGEVLVVNVNTDYSLIDLRIGF